MILNKSNAILAACLHLLATFGLECRAFRSVPSPSAAYEIIGFQTVSCNFLLSVADEVLIISNSSVSYPKCVG